MAPINAIPIRRAPIFRDNKQAQPVLSFIERQEYLGDVFNWVQTRAAQYKAAFNLPEDGIRARAEAGIDLVAWQRRVPSVASNIITITEHEAYCQSRGLR